MSSRWPDGDRLHCPLCGQRDFYPEPETVARWESLMALADAVDVVLSPQAGDTKNALLCALDGLRAARSAYRARTEANDER